MRVGRQAFHRSLTLLEHGAARVELRRRVGVGVDEILDRAIDSAGILIHAGLQLRELGFHLGTHSSVKSFTQAEYGLFALSRSEYTGGREVVTKSSLSHHY